MIELFQETLVEELDRLVHRLGSLGMIVKDKRQNAD
jgi:hypothetical protein